MKPLLLVDTGPLVVGLNRRDRYHAWARDSVLQSDRMLGPNISARHSDLASRTATKGRPAVPLS